MKARDRLGRLVFVTICIAGIGPLRGDAAWTAALAQQALTSGFQATLPPHASVVLGLASKSEGVPVRQLVSRAGQKVHTFNVVIAHPKDVVLFVVDESTQSASAFLISSGGRLVKAVSYQAGGEPRELTASEARPGLVREKRYWSDYAVGSKAGPAPPAPKATDALRPTGAPKPPSGPTSP